MPALGYAGVSGLSASVPLRGTVPYGVRPSSFRLTRRGRRGRVYGACSGDPLGMIELRCGVAKDRRISVEDAEMRHGRKSRSQRFNGYKRLPRACA